jgi:hypothetical protein
VLEPNFLLLISVDAFESASSDEDEDHETSFISILDGLKRDMREINKLQREVDVAKDSLHRL